MKDFFKTFFKTDLFSVTLMFAFSFFLVTFFTAITTIVRMFVQHDLPCTAFDWMLVPVMCHGLLIYGMVQVFLEGGFKSDD